MAIHSHLSAVSKASSEPSEKGNALQAELSAMQDIAFALSQLDEPTRARVLRWVDERFRGDVVVAVPQAALYAVSDFPTGAGPGKAGDDALNDFFDRCDAAEPKLSKDPATVVPAKSVPGMLNDFVADFQDIVREWNVACGEPADGSVEPIEPVESFEPIDAPVAHRVKSQRASKLV